MLQFNPGERFDLKEILEHPWMLGTVPDKSDIVNEFKERKQMIDRRRGTYKEDSRDTRDIGAGSLQSILEDSEFLAWERTAETPTLR